MNRLFLVCVIVGCAGSPLHALGPGNLDGEGDEYWDAKHYSVIVAEVSAVERMPDSSWRATLRPTSTIAGRFDTSEHADLSISSFGHSLESRFVIPKAGDTVLAIIILSKAAGKGWVVPFTYATFMPGAAPLCVIKGPGDPRVAETLKKIQEARVRGRTKAQAGNLATTRPAVKEIKGEIQN
jgi:hypothetical protein